MIFTKGGLWEEVPGPHPHAKFHHCGFKNVGLQCPKSQKKLIFGINLPLGKFWGSVEKVEYRCTTTNLPICKDIIIVLKITPLHSVYVITNFVIRKRDQQKNKLEINMHHFPKAWHGDRGGPCHFCTTNFFSPISNFAAMGH